LNSLLKRYSTATKMTSKVSSTSKSSKSSSKSPKKSPNKNEADSLAVDWIDVECLDDDELFRLLKENGINVGPIVSSTRPFYKKKLAVVLNGGSMVNTSNGSDAYSDTDPESEDDQPSATTVVVTPEATTTRSKTSTFSKSKQSPSKMETSPSFNTSGLRLRMPLDETDSRSQIYKVTETTKQVVTRSKDGRETRDIQHTTERSESKEDNDDLDTHVKSQGSKTSSVVYFLLKMIIICSVLFIIYVIANTPSDGVTPVDQIMDAINSAQVTGASDVEEV